VGPGVPIPTCGTVYTGAVFWGTMGVATGGVAFCVYPATNVFVALPGDVVIGVDSSHPIAYRFPSALPTYTTPFDTVGDEYTLPPVLNRHFSFPVTASIAYRLVSELPT